MIYIDGMNAIFNYKYNVDFNFTFHIKSIICVFCFANAYNGSMTRKDGFMVKSLYELIGERIQSYLNQYNVSQKEFAEQINVSPQVMNKIIQGKKAINAMEIQQIAKALSISTDQLVGEVQPAAPITDPVLYMMGKTENEQTKEKLRFLDHIMEQMLRIKEIAK